MTNDRNRDSFVRPSLFKAQAETWQRWRRAHPGIRASCPGRARHSGLAAILVKGWDPARWPLLDRDGYHTRWDGRCWIRVADPSNPDALTHNKELANV